MSVQIMKRKTIRLKCVRFFNLFTIRNTKLVSKFQVLEMNYQTELEREKSK